jgi:hypothetical protein
MRLEGTSKTKESKYNATISFIVSIGMLLVAFLAFDFAYMPGFGKIFMIIWVFVVIAQGYQAFRNSIFSNNSLHHEVTDHNLRFKDKAGLKKQNTQNCYAEKLRKIESLYREGLLSKEEYLAKRKDVLDEDWGR